MNLLFSKTNNLKLASKGSLANITSIIANSHNQLMSNRYFKRILDRDHQLLHDNITDNLNRITEAMLQTGYILTQNSSNAKQDKFKIVLFPSALRYLILQGAKNNTVAKNKFCFWQNFYDRSLVVSNKTTLVLQAKVVEFLSALAEQLYQHVLHIGGQVQAEAFESTTFFKIFVTPKVAGKYSNSGSAQQMKGHILFNLDKNLCACLLSALDTNNVEEYADCIYAQLKEHYNGFTDFDTLIDSFLAKYNLNAVHSDLPPIKDNKNPAKTTYTKDERKIMCYLLYLWVLISNLAEEAIQNASDLKVQHLRLFRQNMLNERDALNSQQYSTINHMLIDDSTKANPSYLAQLPAAVTAPTA